jgi:hypothetical protein
MSGEWYAVMVVRGFRHLMRVSRRGCMLMSMVDESHRVSGGWLR